MIILHRGSWQQLTLPWRSTHRLTWSHMDYICLKMVKWGYTWGLEHVLTKATIIPIYVIYNIFYVESILGRRIHPSMHVVPHTCQGYFCICVHYIWFPSSTYGMKILNFPITSTNDFHKTNNMHKHKMGRLWLSTH